MGAGKKKICRLDKDDISTLSPPFPCDPSNDGGKAKKNKPINLGGCRPDAYDGNLGRQQMRQVCSGLFNKDYEPDWRPIEIEDHHEWWAFMKLLGGNVVPMDSKDSSC